MTTWKCEKNYKPYKLIKFTVVNACRLSLERQFYLNQQSIYVIYSNLEMWNGQQKESLTMPRKVTAIIFQKLSTFCQPYHARNSFQNYILKVVNGKLKFRIKIRNMQHFSTASIGLYFTGTD